ncbi:MAG: tRNA (adenosine(37)-N6)-threonylcarbamoyltransferase complex transferase subunit TsaD [Candidatus Aminicenantes bacterium]|nr:tRNA (adenosine(37)-N6)-threonylcarbamoyltransferase complex transferase subunit TsaD [Candidatus Aminicenantes bacterium]MDH5384814.1 tRNA (adenosine(37)-N6)-threonylcarbamoyltransferase complex transferase subunit TsaD [Candidatus Aminicenantes bacterium]
MYFLGIETSCDETSSAVLDDRLRILSSVVLSQDEIHAPYGGVVPELASRQHIQSIGYVVEESLQRAGLSLRKIDVYAVTQGPGLIGSLLVGLSFAKGLAFFFGKPLIPVDHLEAHIHSAFLENKGIPFPSLALLVSGGHTSLFFMEKKFHYQLIGRTRDDAAGEALDKIAKFLDLGYPGGPIIDKMAEKGNPRTFAFALPHMTDKSLDFSFSGLKTAALKQIKKKDITKDHRQFLDFLASFEKAVIRALLNNMNRAAKRYKPKSLILCGGVARNKKLRRDFIEFAQKLGLPSFIPSPELCTDNAAMVAALAADKFKEHPGMSFPFDLNAYPRM